MKIFFGILAVIVAAIIIAAVIAVFALYKM